MSEDMNGKLTMDYVLEQIEKVADSTEYLHKIIQALDEMENSDVPGDMTGPAKAEALAAIVKSRETTNQQLLSMYNTMFHMLLEEKKST